MTKTIITIVGIVIIVFAGVLFFSNSQPSPAQTDELTGTWYTEGQAEEIKWTVKYVFKNERYTSTITQDNGAETRIDEGPYKILTRFGDGTMDVLKQSETQNKSYEVVIQMIEDGNALLLEGMRMDRIE